MRNLGAVLGLAVLIAGPAAADLVVPSQRVRSGVLIREYATRDSRPLGSLRPGDEAEYLTSVPGWIHVRLENGTRGFVSRAWTQVIPDAAAGPAAVAAAPRSPTPGLLGAIRSAVTSIFRWKPRVDFVIREPHPRQAVYRGDTVSDTLVGVLTHEPECEERAGLGTNGGSGAERWAACHLFRRKAPTRSTPDPSTC